MTQKYAQMHDNNGNCETCNKANGGVQTTVPVMLGGGMGMGTMWMCARCIAERGGEEKIRERAEKGEGFIP